MHSGWTVLKISIRRLEKLKMYDKSTRNKNLLKRYVKKDDVMTFYLNLTCGESDNFEK